MAYLNFMQPKMSAVRTLLSTISRQASMAGSNPPLMLGASWRIKTGAALGIMKALGDEIQKYEPVPDGAERLDAIMVALGKDLVYAADEYAAGLDTVNPRRLDNAVQRMNTMHARLPQAVAEVKALSGQ
jgi:hypothetical protein